MRRAASQLARELLRKSAVQALYLAMVWLHIIAAAAWVGGMIFFAAVVVPVVRHPDYRAKAGDLVHRVGRRYRVLGWTSLAALVISGTYLLDTRGVGLTELTSASFYATSFGKTVAAKLLMIGAILVATLVHDISMGPKATRLLRERPDDPRAQRIRLVARYWGRANLLFALVVVALGVMLVRGAPW